MILQYHQEVLILMYKLVQLIYTHCSQMFGQNYKYNLSFCYFCMVIILKNNLWFIQTCFFCDQTHGRTNKLPIKIIIFSLSNIMV